MHDHFIIQRLTGDFFCKIILSRSETARRYYEVTVPEGQSDDIAESFRVVSYDIMIHHIVTEGIEFPAKIYCVRIYYLAEKNFSSYTQYRSFHIRFLSQLLYSSF